MGEGGEGKDADFFSNMPIEDHSTFESTQNKQQYGTKTTCTEVRKN